MEQVFFVPAQTLTGVILLITAMLDLVKYECWAWEAWTKMSATFLLSPLDQLGFMEDEVFQVGIATYLGQPCPLTALVTGCYFGKQGEKLDRFGANLAAASLPGHGQCSLHNPLINNPGHDEIRGNSLRC
jgi:hypothetical protein